MRPEPMAMTLDLFDQIRHDLALSEGASLLGGFALPVEGPLLAGLDTVVAEAPFRHMVTPGRFPMAVAMPHCGAVGWVTDRRGYRYDAADPESGRPWPAMPAAFTDLAQRAAATAGFGGFPPGNGLPKC